MPPKATFPPQPLSQGDGSAAVTNVFAHASTALDVASSLSGALSHLPYVSAIFGTLKKILDVANVSGNFYAPTHIFEHLLRQEMRQDKEECTELAVHARHATTRILSALIGQESYGGDALNTELAEFSS